MKKTIHLLAAVLICNLQLVTCNCFAQSIGISSTGNTPNASALLDVDASPSNNKGMLIPRVTQAQRIAMNPLPAAAQGLTVYQTDGTQGFYYNLSTTTVPNWAFLVPNSCTGYDNLVIQSTSTSTVTITADRLCVDSLSLSNINATIDIASTGANGLMSGLTEVANTWYYVWIIAKDDGTTAGLLTTSSTTVTTMPAGYTKKRRVGTVRNNASSNFLQFVQEGNKVLYADAVVSSRILTAGTATTFTSVSASGFVPPTSRTGLFELTSSLTGTAGTAYHAYFRPSGSSASIDIMVQNYNQVTGIASANNVISPVSLDILQNLEYKITVVPTSGGAYVDVHGYYDRF